MTTGAKQKSFTKGAMVLLGTSLAALTLMASTSVSAEVYNDYDGYVDSRMDGYWYSRGGNSSYQGDEYVDSRMDGYWYSRGGNSSYQEDEYVDSRMDGYWYSRGGSRLGNLLAELEDVLSQMKGSFK